MCHCYSVSDAARWGPEGVDLSRDHAAVLVALYLRGGPFGPVAHRRAWPVVLGAIRRTSVGLAEAERALRGAGLREEAHRLAAPGRLAWAERVVQGGKALTVADARFPDRWVRALGAGAPPALWRRGAMPVGPLVSVVGSRYVRRAVWGFAEGVAREAVRLGFAVASGGAPGCDSAAALGAIKAGGALRPSFAPLLEIWPCGLEARRTRRPGCVLSLCEPEEPFSSAGAMERNLLLYAIAELSVVGHARFKEGGSWHGAVEANRRRVGRLAVRWDPKDRAARALVGLGAFPMESPDRLAAALNADDAQLRLAIAGS